MSFLRNHLRHFVIPGIHTLARANGKTVTVDDIKPRDREVRPSTNCKFVEAGMLYALVSSILRKGDPTREIALGLCRQIGRAKDAEFVYALETRGAVKGLGAGYDGVEGSDVLHSMLCNSMRRLKRKMRRNGSLLLPGRDVWCWEVLARKLTVPSVYDARVSRSVAWNDKALKTCVDDWKIQDWKDILFFDTGFSGSIPRAIGRVVGLDQINMLLLSSVDTDKQIFRTHTGSRAKALAFEYLAKYHQRGTHRDGTPYQELNSLDEFIKAALLTIWLWYHVSPARLPSYRDKKLPTGAKKPTFTIAQTPGVLSVTPLGGSIQNSAGEYLTDGGWVSATTSTTGNWQVTTSNTSGAGNWGFSSGASALDQLWAVGPSGQIMVEDFQPKKVPIKPIVMDPNTLKPVDAVTGESIEAKLDAKALDIQDGFELGQYPGPPVLTQSQLAALSGSPPGTVPEISLEIEVDKKTGQCFKKTVFKTPYPPGKKT